MAQYGAESERVQSLGATGRTARELELEAEVSRLRAALATAGIDADDALAAAIRAQQETSQARDDATQAAAEHAREMEAGRAGLARAETLNKGLSDRNAALTANQVAMATSESRLRAALSIKTVSVLFWGPDLRLIEVNDAFLSMTGFTRNEALGLTWQELTPVEFHPASLKAVAELTSLGEIKPYEKQYFRKDGSRWWGLFAGRRVGDETVEFVLDVTERREAQEALRQSEERFRVIVENARDYAILIIDPQGHILDWLPGAAAVFGWTAEEAIGQPVAVTFTPEDREQGIPEKEIQTAWTEGTAMDVRWHLRCDGSRVFIEGSMVALHGANGELQGFLKIGQDVTKRRTDEAALRRLNETLEAQVEARTAELRQAVNALNAEIRERAQTEEALRQAQKMEAIGQLTGGIAHDFNNMLQGIGGSLDVMRTRIAQGRATEIIRYVDLASQTVGRAARLTQRLLAFARRQILQPEPVNTDALIESMGELIQRMVGPSVRLELCLGDGSWPVQCDPNQLENGLLNLAINARDAMPEGGLLSIGTRHVQLSAAEVVHQEGARPGDYVEIAVSDTGSGMDEATRARVFEPFFTTKPLGHGTGLGLPQLYGFVRQSFGVVLLDSVLGEGTTVRFYLPRHGQDGHAAERASSHVAPNTGRAGAAGAGTILLVEDEANVRRVTADHLRELGFEVLEAADGPSALRILRDDQGTRPDLLVTDVGLPNGLNGRQVADAAREHWPQLPVLFITGYAGDVLGTQFEAGMAVMTKPFALEALVSRVQEMI